MTKQEFFEIAGYFANPIRITRIEIEGRQITINNYAIRYLNETGLQFPFGTDSITSLPDNANKRGREMRIYFSSQSMIPPIITHLMTVGGRPGYDEWDKRLNSRDIIDDLISIGFVLGNPQSLSRIQGHISAFDLNDFNNGFNMS